MGLGVIDDVRFQHSNFRHPCFGGFDGISQLVIFFCCRRCAFIQFICAANFVLLQENQRLGHFFQIISLCPASIPHALSLGQLCLNVHQHLKLLFRYDALLLLPGMVFGFPRDNSFQFFFTISCAQSAEPDESLLPCAFDGGVFSTLDLIILLLQSLQKIFVVFGLFRQNSVNHAT